MGYHWKKRIKISVNGILFFCFHDMLIEKVIKLYNTKKLLKQHLK